ncbi:hypothetical protein WJ972_13690 [Achromobacter insuavis]
MSARGAGGEKPRRFQREAVRRRADLVAREQGTIAIEQGVFQGLGGQGRRQLLEVAQRPRPRAAQGIGDVVLLRLAGRPVEPLVQQIEQAVVGVAGRRGQRRARAGQRGLPVPLVDGAAAAVFGIAAVGGKRRQQRAQHAVDSGRGPVAGTQVQPRDPREGAYQHQPFRGEVPRQHQLARPQQLRRWRPAVVGERLPEGLQRRLRGGRVQQRAGLVHVVIARGACHWPAWIQRLVLGEDLLHDQIGHGRQPCLRARGRRLRQGAAQLAQVGAWRGQAVDMIDAQAVQHAFAEQAQRQGMDRIEHDVVLDPHPDQAGDLEEAPPVDLVGGGAPPGQAVVLALQQLMQPAAALWGVGRMGVTGSGGDCSGCGACSSG